MRQAGRAIPKSLLSLGIQKKPQRQEASSMTSKAQFLKLLRPGVVLTVTLGLGMGLAGCVRTGDFGRPEPSAFVTAVTDQVTRVKAFLDDDTSEFILTVSEQALRDAALHFRNGIGVNRPIKGEIGGETAYAERLRRAGFSHGPARLSEISAQLEADHGAFDRFEQAVREVVAADEARLTALASPLTSYSDRDRRNVRARVLENREIVRATFRDLKRRIQHYDYALERARIEAPEARVREPALRLNLLRERVESLRYELARQGYFSSDPLPELARPKTPAAEILPDPESSL